MVVIDAHETGRYGGCSVLGLPVRRVSPALAGVHTADGWALWVIWPSLATDSTEQRESTSTSERRHGCSWEMRTPAWGSESHA